MITALVVVFEFPPLNTGGVYRPLGFVRYLADWRVTPVVVTTTIDSTRAWFGSRNLDDTTVGLIPPGIEVRRVRAQAPRRGGGRVIQRIRTLFSLTDGIAAAWVPYLRKSLPELFREYSVDAIYVTVPPFSIAPALCDIAGSFDIPIVVDFRDPWSLWTTVPYVSVVHYLGILRRERRVLESADAIITTSEQTRRDLLQLHNVEPQKIQVILNGYDESVTDWSVRRNNTDTSFKIGYVGGFYFSPRSRDMMFRPWWTRPPHKYLNYTPRQEDWLYRSPYFVFKAIRLLFDEWPELAGKVELHFAGHKPEWFDEQVAEFGLQQKVICHGFIPQREILGFEDSCDALLVTSSKVVGGRSYSIAGKTLQYFERRKPILAFVTEGAQRDLLEKSGLAVICDPDKPTEAARKVRSLVAGEAVLSANVDFLRGLHRSPLAGQLAKVLRSVVG